jgi:hypothetical protein
MPQAPRTAVSASAARSADDLGTGPPGIERSGAAGRPAPLPTIGDAGGRGIGVIPRFPWVARGRRASAQDQTERRKARPSVAMASCERAKGRQIDAAVAIDALSAVKDSMHSGPA